MRPDDTHDRYLVVWGVLQAFIIQQDALYKLHQMFVDCNVKKKGFKSEYMVWHELRTLRDEVAGHPTGSSNVLMTIAIGQWDWGVRSRRGDLYPYILDRISKYEDELLDAAKQIGDGIQARVREVDGLHGDGRSG